jgi:hypothetical protein
MAPSNINNDFLSLVIFVAVNARAKTTTSTSFTKATCV